MFEEKQLATISTVVAIYSRFFPDKCTDDDALSELIEYMETSTDPDDVKKINIYSMCYYLDHAVIMDIINALEIDHCPAIQELKEIISVTAVATDFEETEIDYGENVIVNEDETDELIHEINEVIQHNNPLIVADPKYEEIMMNCVREHFEPLIEDGIVDEDDFEKKATLAITEYYKQCPRQGGTPTNDDPLIPDKLMALSAVNQADQRTAEWYEKRHALITASSAWKVLDSQANFNSFVLSKCQPYEPYGPVNINSPLHWGQKYEPVSVQLYELVARTRVGEFGCITHPIHTFLGASPDGINIDPKSPRYGRMLEIKNIVNREITGIPKKEYWIQMQLQMEVCDLNCCDFLETVFKEYPSSAEFELDTGDSFNKTASGAYKGIIAMFYKGTTPVYEYCPLSEEHDTWMESVVDRNPDKLFIKYIYWWLEEWSLVTVLRNREWFEANVGTLRSAWETIQREKVTGFDHRKPVKKAKKEDTPAITINITTNIDHLDDEEERPITSNH